MVHLKATWGRGQPLNLDTVLKQRKLTGFPLQHDDPTLSDITPPPLPILGQSRVATIELVASWVSVGMALRPCLWSLPGGWGGG